MWWIRTFNFETLNSFLIKNFATGANSQLYRLYSSYHNPDILFIFISIRYLDLFFLHNYSWNHQIIMASVMIKKKTTSTEIKVNIFEQLVKNKNENCNNMLNYCNLVSRCESR